MSETAKWRHETRQYCQGSGVDIGSGGDLVVPWAISIDQTPDDMAAYGTTCFTDRFHLRGDARHLPWFRDGVLDFAYSSHLLEDFREDEWVNVLNEWQRVVRVGGHLVILVPDRELWGAALAAGQTPNCAHKYEPRLGDLSGFFKRYFQQWDVLRESYPENNDYTIIFVARRRE